VAGSARCQPSLDDLPRGVEVGQLDVLGDRREADVGEDDVVPVEASVDFNFTAPTVFGGTIEGNTYGWSSWFGILQHGVLRWDNDGVKSLYYGTGILGIRLKDVEFGGGWFGLDDSWTAVKSSFSLRAPAQVPEPFTLGLLGGGLVLLAAIRRRTLRSTSNRS
jgi:hypothetical protein